jgi:hypothetical protein
MLALKYGTKAEVDLAGCLGSRVKKTSLNPNFWNARQPQRQAQGNASC